MPPSDLRAGFFGSRRRRRRPRETRDIYTASRLNREARTLLERGLPALWLEGEISNSVAPLLRPLVLLAEGRGGPGPLRHVPPAKHQLARFTPRDGQHVLVRGRVSLYEPRGDYQLIVEHMEEAGEGALRQRDSSSSRRSSRPKACSPPSASGRCRACRAASASSPRPTGAAIRDVLHILRARFPPVAVLHLSDRRCKARPRRREIARDDRGARRRRAECDVLILARGGGSLEDLWAFNDESVARAIYDCAAPDRHRHRPRGRFHDRGFRRRRARADAFGRGRAGRAGQQRVAAQCRCALTQSARRRAQRARSRRSRIGLRGWRDGCSSCIRASSCANARNASTIWSSG